MTDLEKEFAAEDEYSAEQARKTKFYGLLKGQIETLITNAKTAGKNSVEICIGIPRDGFWYALTNDFGKGNYSITMEQPSDSHIHHSEFYHIYNTRISWK